MLPYNSNFNFLTVQIKDNWISIRQLKRPPITWVGCSSLMIMWHYMRPSMRLNQYTCPNTRRDTVVQNLSWDHRLPNDFCLTPLQLGWAFNPKFLGWIIRVLEIATWCWPRKSITQIFVYSIIQVQVYSIFLKLTKPTIFIEFHSILKQ